MVLDTPRLILRPWTMDDVEAAFRMYGDPEVTRFLGTGANEPDIESQREHLAKAIEKYDSLGKLGFMFWAAQEKATGEVVGAGLLKPLPASDDDHSPEEVEVGWHLAKPHWGRGLGTEIGRAALDHGFEKVGLSRILAVAYPENLASLRIMEKLGMRRLGETDRYYGVRLIAYEARRDWT